MADWQFVVGPATGGHTAALTLASGRKVTFKLTDASDAGFVLDGRSVEAQAIEELATDLHAIRDGRILYRGRVGATSDSLDADSHSVDVRTMDYREILNRRILSADDQKTYGQVDQASIAWGLIAATQTKPGGDLGVTRGLGSDSGFLRDRTYAAGDTIGALLEDLAALVDGFDWDLTPIDAYTLRLDLWHGINGRGASGGVYLEYGAGVLAVKRDVSVDTYANAVRVSGASSTLLELREAADLADRNARPEGRWDGVFGFTDVTTQTRLTERAMWQLADSQAIRPTYSIDLAPDVWQGPDHIWLGDYVRLRVLSGRLAVDTSLRVYEIAVGIGEDGSEDVSMTLGGPKPDYRRRPAEVNRRLRNLERR